MNENVATYYLCKILDPGRKIIEEARRFAQEYANSQEIIQARHDEVNSPEFAIKYGQDKYLESCVELDNAKAELRKNGEDKYNDIHARIMAHIDDQKRVSMEAYYRSDMTRKCREVIESGMIRNPDELASMWNECSNNPVCCRMIGAYAVKMHWDNVFVGDRYSSVMEVVETFLTHLRNAILSDVGSYGMIWILSPTAMGNLAINLGVFEEFGIDITAEEYASNGISAVERGKAEAEHAFRKEAEARRITEYAPCA